MDRIKFIVATWWFNIRKLVQHGYYNQSAGIPEMEHYAYKSTENKGGAPGRVPRVLFIKKLSKFDNY